MLGQKVVVDRDYADENADEQAEPQQDQALTVHRQVIIMPLGRAFNRMREERRNR